MIVTQSYSSSPNSGLTITDTEITRPVGSNGGADYGIYLNGGGVTLTRIHIHNVTSGIHFSGNGVTLQDSYITGLVNISGQDHLDGVIANGGTPNVTLRHNTIEVPNDTVTPIAMFPEGSPNSYWTVDNNLLAGGAFCIYSSYTRGDEQPNHHITVTNNVFGKQLYPSCGSIGPVDPGRNGASFFDGVGNVWSGNVWAGTDIPVLSK